jgi:hypothetical protein
MSYQMRPSSNLQPCALVHKKSASCAQEYVVPRGQCGEAQSSIGAVVSCLSAHVTNCAVHNHMTLWQVEPLPPMLVPYQPVAVAVLGTVCLSAEFSLQQLIMTVTKRSGIVNKRSTLAEKTCRDPQRMHARLLLLM